MQLQAFLNRLMWAGMAPLLGLSVVLLGLRVYQLEGRLEHSANDLLSEAMRDVESDLALRRSTLEVLAASPLLDDAAPMPDLHRHLRSFATHFGGHVLLVGSSQQVLLHTGLAPGDAMPALPRPTRHSAVAAVQAGLGAAVGDMFQGPVAQRPLVALAVPVQRENQTLRILLATMEVRQLQRVLEHLALPAGWSLDLRDGAGALMASRRTEGTDTAADAGPAQPPAALHFVRPFVQAPWTLSLTVSPSARFSPLVQGSSFILAGGLLAWGLAVAGSRSAALRLARGLEALAEPREAAADHTSGSPPGGLPSTQAAVAQAQRKLQLSAARTQAIVSHAADAIITCDKNLMIRSANPAARRFWQADTDQLVGSPLKRWIPQRHQHHFEEWAAQRQQEPQPQEAQEQRKLMTVALSSGQELIVDVRGSRVCAADEDFYVVVLRDMSELVQARKDVEQSASDLRRLIDRMNSVQEEERTRISRDLHDDLQQRLAVAELVLSAMTRTARAGETVQEAQVLEVRSALRDMIAATRRIVRDLRPTALEELGLAAALEQVVQAGGMGLEEGCKLEVRGEAEPAPAAATCLYRVTQEALNNVRKHALARCAQVRLDLTSPKQVTLEVEDDGVGLPEGVADGRERGAAQASAGLRHGPEGLRNSSGVGMLGMAERLRAVGGRLEVSRGPARGTLLRAVVPRGPQEGTTGTL